MFSHSAAATAEAVEAASASGLPRWAKLSPNVGDLCEIAAAALDAGAEALTLVNTLLGMALDPDAVQAGLPEEASGEASSGEASEKASQGASQEASLAVFPGGLSGPALHPVALRAVYDCRQAFPGVGIVGVGGVDSGRSARALLAVGADAVQVGTATFADPRAPWKVQAELAGWCRRQGVTVKEAIGAALR